MNEKLPRQLKIAAEKKRLKPFDFWTIIHAIAGVIVTLFYKSLIYDYITQKNEMFYFFLGIIVVITVKSLFEVFEYLLYKKIFKLKIWKESVGNRTVDIFIGVLLYLVVYLFV